MATPHPTSSVAITLLAALATAAWSCGHDAHAGAVHTNRGGASSGLQGIPRGIATKVALLVGINRYERPDTDDTFEDLHGCHHDVDRLKGVLVSRFGFASTDVVVLRDVEATHAGIVQAFQRALIDRAGPGTEAVFFYAGHGSRLPDLSGKVREFEGKDWTLVAYDARKKGRREPFDLTDDELYSLLAALRQRQARITVITDACHSADATRGGSSGVRNAPDGLTGVPMARLAGFWPKSIPLLDDDDAGWPSGDLVHLAACGPQQQAGEREIELADGGKGHVGLFTSLLCEELERIEPGATYAALAQRVAARMATQRAVYFQEPAASGATDRQIFAGTFGPPLHGFAALMEAEPSARVLVRAGWVHGLVHKAVLELETVNGDKIGRVTLGLPGAHETWSTWIERPALRFAPSTAMRGFVRELPPDDPPLRVAIGAGDAEDRLAKLLAASTNPRLKVVRQPAGPGDYRVLRAEGSLHLVVDDLELGAPIPFASAGDAEPAQRLLIERLANEARYRSLLRLGDSRSPILPSLSIEAPGPNEKLPVAGAAPAILDRATKASIQVVDRPNVKDAARLRIGIPGNPRKDGSFYVTILSITEDRGVTAIFPRPRDGERSNRFEAGTTLAGERTLIHLFRPETWKLDRPMLDRYVVLLTRSYVDVEPLGSKGGLVQKAGLLRERLSERTRGGEHALPAVIQKALAGSVTRGEGFEPSDSYGIATLDVVVSESR